jgi:hypothetical protein
MFNIHPLRVWIITSVTDDLPINMVGIESFLKIRSAEFSFFGYFGSLRAF